MKFIMNMRFIKKLNFFGLVLSLWASFGLSSLSWADGEAVPAGLAATPSAAAQQPGGLMAFAPFIMMFGVLYFLVLRPQQKKLKEQQNMIAALKQGDEVLTSSGILGKIIHITEKVITVEVAEGVRIKMLKSQISQVVKGSL